MKSGKKTSDLVFVHKNVFLIIEISTLMQGLQDFHFTFDKVLFPNCPLRVDREVFR